MAQYIDMTGNVDVPFTSDNDIEILGDTLFTAESVIGHHDVTGNGRAETFKIFSLLLQKRNMTCLCLRLIAGKVPQYREAFRAYHNSS